MLAVVKTLRTSVRIKGQISKKLIEVLIAEYGKDIQFTRDPEDELVDVFQTDWYKKTKKTMTPGIYMKIFRENRNMTQAQLGKKLGGMPRQHVSNMENGLRPISKKIALKLSEVFDVSVEKFIGT
jgi:DNA-binding XRE family transcriptional regulator